MKTSAKKSWDDRVVRSDDVLIIAETEKAICCEGIVDYPVWIPKSQVHDDSEIWRKDDEGTLTITRWWAEEENLV